MPFWQKSNGQPSLTLMRRAFLSYNVASTALSGLLSFLVLSAIVGTIMSQGGLPGWAGIFVAVTMIGLATAIYSFIDVILCRMALVSAILAFGAYLAGVHLFGELYGRLAANPQAWKAEDTYLTCFVLFASWALGLYSLYVLMMSKEERWLIAQDQRGGHFRLMLSSMRRDRGVLPFNALGAVLHALARFVSSVGHIFWCVLLGAMMFNIIETGMTLMRLVSYGYRPPAGQAGSGPTALTIALFLVIVLAAASALSKAGMWLLGRARHVSRITYDRVREIDTRPPILFLRSFSDDQVLLPRTPLFLRYLLSEPGGRRLDHELVERLSIYGPVVAFGSEEDRQVPFGAARIYVPNQGWDAEVIGVLDRALGAILVVDDTAGVHWEIQAALSEAYVERTLFLANPAGGPDLFDHPLLAGHVTRPSDLPRNQKLIGAYRSGGDWRLMLSRKLIGDDYVCCCYTFIKHRVVVSRASGASR